MAKTWSLKKRKGVGYDIGIGHDYSLRGVYKIILSYEFVGLNEYYERRKAEEMTQ